MDPSFSIETIIDDFDDLHRELMRELSGEGSINVPQIMEQHGEEQKLANIRFRIDALLRAVRDRLSSVSRDMPAEGSRAEINPALEGQVRKTLEELSQLEALAGRLNDLLTMIDLKTSANASQSIRSAVSTAIATAKTWLSVITSWIKRISAQLWNLLCGLMTPKEWKLGGKVGTGILGLADVTLEITFGP
ncbi:hypothetical protein [Hyphomicrobium sp.]|uniref:hypothetical protein n=1 Tax=Hyphomicrobium sp. TaxID=82 RepID=UPI000FA3AD7E|nr:hypothetical protein [Hyphomicrobium sp.]RUP00632.1 MAG: hypothetical protein EKK30_00820 [Hyphomicrobium sp.]